MTAITQQPSSEGNCCFNTLCSRYNYLGHRPEFYVKNPNFDQSELSFTNPFMADLFDCCEDTSACCKALFCPCM